MGLLDKFFGTKKEGNQKEKTVAWIPLTEISQLDDVVEASKKSKAIIFKHSTRCNISATVLNKFERKIEEEYQLYFLDLINYREVSNAVAENFGIVHQSPQVIVFENEVVRGNASHYEILDLDL